MLEAYSPNAIEAARRFIENTHNANFPKELAKVIEQDPSNAFQVAKILLDNQVSVPLNIEMAVLRNKRFVEDYLKYSKKVNVRPSDYFIKVLGKSKNRALYDALFNEKAKRDEGYFFDYSGTTITFKPDSEIDILDFLEKAIQLAKVTKHEIEIEFNTYKTIIRPTTTVDKKYSIFKIKMYPSNK